MVECLYQATSGLHRSKWQQNILPNTEDLLSQASRQNKGRFSKLQVYSPMSWILVEIFTTVIICSCHFSFLKISGTSRLHIQDQTPYEFILNVQTTKSGVWHNVSVRRTHTRSPPIAKPLAVQPRACKVFIYSCVRNATPHEFNCGTDLSFEIKALINMLGAQEFKEGVWLWWMSLLHTENSCCTFH